MTPTYLWTHTAPTRPGHYWFMIDNDCDPEIVRVFLAPGERELSVQLGVDEIDDADYVINMHSALWSNHPVPLPRYPKNGSLDSP